jgi:hypothetical protein
MHSHNFNRRIKHLGKLFDVIKAHAKLLFSSTHRHHALTIRDYKSIVVTFSADSGRQADLGRK